MSRNKVGLRTINDDRGPSINLWADCPWSDIQDDPNKGQSFWDDFTLGSTVAAGAEAGTRLYKGFADTGGSVVDAAELGGALTFSSDGDNEGASLMSLATSFVLTQDGGDFWFEARIKKSTIADTKHGFFLGLANSLTLSATVPIAADGTIADENLVGFHNLEADGDTVDSIYKADGVTQVTVEEEIATLVAATYIKLGFKVTNRHETNNRYQLSFFVDGVESATRFTVPDATGTDFPADIAMGPVFAVLNATGSTPGNSTMEWWRGAQLFC